MKKKVLLSIIILCLTVTGLLFWHSHPALAAFNGNNLMDDGVFDKANSMTAVQIDNWLNSNFPTSCISTNNGFSSPDTNGYSPSTGFIYGGNVSAGTVINHAAYAYGINPQVILATLQKESSVVSGDASYGCQYINTAMGYDCPDSGSCPRNPATESGFSKQVIHAAWMLRFHEQRSKGNVGWQETKPGWDNSDDPQTCYSGRMIQGTYQICPSGPSAFYDGWYTIDATAVHMDTGATAALYDYTPHFHGNQNFDSIFQSWFGSIYDVYSWSPVSQYAFTDSSKTTGVDLTNLLVGQKVFVGFQARNTGDTAWTNTGSSPVDAGTTSPQDRNSAFCDTADSPSWMGCSRPAAMQEASVAPGQTGTFEFWYKAPAQAGTYNEHFSLVAEGIKWMNDNGLYFHTVVKPPTYTWASVGQFAFTDSSKTTAVDLTNLNPGQRVFIGFNIKNTGNVSWPQAGSNPVHSATSSPRDRISAFCDPTWISCNRPAVVNENNLAPGQTGTVELWYQAPSSPGIYREGFSMVAEGVTWMNDTGMNFYTIVHFDTSGTNTSIGTNQSLSSGQSITSANGLYKLIMQGDGNLVLYSVSHALWSSNTAGKPVVKVIMQGDGNLVLYDLQNKPYWSSGTAGRGVSSLVMQNDGNLVIYDSGNHPTWASYTNGRL